MSYTIFYRTLFVKTRDGSLIPFVECGSNNVWDPLRRRRSRDWEMNRWAFENDGQKDRYAMSGKEILDLARQEIDTRVAENAGVKKSWTDHVYTKEEVLENLSFFSCIQISGHSTTTAQQFMSFFRSGIRDAVTFDDLRRHGCSVRLSWWENGRETTEYAASEEELEQKWKGFLSRGMHPCIGLGYQADLVWEGMKASRRREQLTRKISSGCFRISFSYREVRRYVLRITARGITYCDEKKYAYRYSSVKSAENATEKIRRRFKDVSDIRVETCNV